MTREQAEKYLRFFGYLSQGTAGIAEAVAAFRRTFGLPHGDEVDDQVLRAMQAPRCGMPDHRMATEESRWRKKSLTYHVASYVNGLSRADQDDLIELAWRDWMAAADISVTRAVAPGAADIVISTGRGQATGFDGAQGTLAWAQLPQGDDRPLLMRFDLDETWIKDPRDRGIIFKAVAAHEFGHCLGLDHSQARGALMAPYYNAAIASPQANDDVPRIQALYGPPAAPPSPPPSEGQAEIVLRFEKGKPLPDFECLVRRP